MLVLQQLTFSAQAGYTVAAEFILQTFEYPLCLVTLAPQLQLITLARSFGDDSRASASASIPVPAVALADSTGTSQLPSRMRSAQGRTQLGQRAPGHRAHVLLVDYQHVGDFQNTCF